MKCNSCGEEIRDTARFCGFCGADQSQNPADQMPAMEVPAAAETDFAMDVIAPEAAVIADEEPITEIPELEVAPAVFAEPESTFQPESIVEPAAAAEPEPIAEPVPVAEPEPVAEPVPAAEPEPVAEPVAETAPVAEPAPVAAPIPEPVVQPAPAPVPEPKPTPVVTPVPAPQPAPQPVQQPVYQAPQPVQQPVYQAPQPVQQPQPQYQAPQPVYQAPQPQYQAPQPMYQAPQPQYQAPQPMYQAPQPQYQAPQPVYQAPQPQYQAPQPMYQAPQPQYQPRPQYQPAPQPVQQPQYQPSKPTVQRPACQLTTGRGLFAMILLGIITCGIYPIVMMCRMSVEINMVASRYDGKRTTHFLFMPFFTALTLCIYPIVWYHKLCRRIGDELDRRNIRYKFGASSFWLWNFLYGFIASAVAGAVGYVLYTMNLDPMIVYGVSAALVIVASVGPAIFCHKFLKAFNLMNADYNEKG
ncbi:MAG: DUF4234 domain-containing protein [Ruminococcaceae bacterium]|nr:DUF4234 domain-containing protein [Oscillospiraceae bacterium]